MVSLLNSSEFHVQAVKYFIYVLVTSRSFVGLQEDSAKPTLNMTWVFSVL